MKRYKVFYSLVDGSTFEFMHDFEEQIFPIGSILYNTEITGIAIYIIY